VIDRPERSTRREVERN